MSKGKPAGRERERESERASERERERPTEVIDNQPISDDRVNGERGIGERDDAALYDSLPGRSRVNIEEPAEQYRSTAPCFSYHIGIIPRVSSASRNLSCIISCKFSV